MTHDRAPGPSRRSSVGPWRLIHGDGRADAEPGEEIAPADGVTNMATDTALLESVAAGLSPALRLYRWSPACLSFGRNQPTRGRYDTAGAATRGIDLVRRPTGGQAVLHDDELTYAVVAPVSVIGKPRAAYARINRALVAGLARLGAAVTMAGDEGGVPAPGGGGRDWDAACFRRPERGEVVARGAKLVGSAQRMEGRTILQHGSILVGGTQAPAESLLLEPVAAPAGEAAGGAPTAASGPTTGVGGWTTLESVLGERPALEAVAEAVAAGFAEVFGVAMDGAGLSESESEGVARLRRRYASDDWTWRR